MTETRSLAAGPGATYHAYRTEIDAAVQRVLASGWYLQGEETARFEAEWARYLGVEHAITTGSGTDALALALRALGVGPGDAVATVSHTAVATVTAIDLAGALPVLVDVEPKGYGMDPERLDAALRSAIGRRIKAVIPVHLYGHPAEITAIARLAQRHGLAMVEDCAQAHGAAVAGRKAGTFAAFGAFSFYPTKNLGAFGDGGALVTGDARLAERARCLKQYGWRERYVSDLPGMNTRLDELQAAVLRAKLPHLDADNARRRRLAAIYREMLTDTGIELPGERPGCFHVYHQFVIRMPERDRLAAYLKACGMSTAVLYPVPVHRQRGYQDRVLAGPGGLRRTDALCHEILCLPIHPGLHEAEARLIAEAVACWADEEMS